MAPKPIELTMASAPVVLSTSAQLEIAAESRIIDRFTVAETHVGGSNITSLGYYTQVDQIVADPLAERTLYVEESNLIYASFRDGVHVAPEYVSPEPYIGPYTLYFQPLASNETLEQAEAMLRNGTYDSNSAGVMYSPKPFISTHISCSNIHPGVTYQFFISAYDQSDDYINTISFAGKTNLNPTLTSFDVNNLITNALIDIETFDADSGVDVFAAVTKLPYQPGLHPATLVNMLSYHTDSKLPFDYYYGGHGSNTDTTRAHFSNLDFNSSYTAVVVLVDTFSKAIVSYDNLNFSTKDISRVDSIEEVEEDRGYAYIKALADVDISTSNTDLVTGFVPNNPVAISNFINLGIDPLSSLDRVNYPLTGKYEFEFDMTGLNPYTEYVAIAKVIPQLQPEEFRYLTTVLRTASPPQININDPFGLFFFGTADWDVTDIDSTVNAYAAIHPATTSPEDARDQLLSLGSIAFPGAQVVVGTSNCADTIFRDDLQDGTKHYVTVVAVETADSNLVTWKTQVLWTKPIPVITLNSYLFTETALQPVASTYALDSHDIYFHLTPYVINGSVIYDPVHIVANHPTDPNTYVIPNQSNEVTNPEVYYPSWSNLDEHKNYGIVMLAVQTYDNRILSEEAIVLKTASLPDVDITIIKTSYDDVDYRVTSFDLDSSFRLITGVSDQAFQQADVNAFVAAGMNYTGSGIVNGTQNDYPGDSSNFSIDFTYNYNSLELLDPDTVYNALAIAVDADTNIVQWQQQLFKTDFRPLLTIENVVSTSTTVDFDITVQDRDGPSLNIKYNVYSYSNGLIDDVVLLDPNATSLVSTHPGGYRRIDNLRLTGLNANAQLFISAVAIDAKGHVSELNNLSVIPFRTDIIPDVSIEILETGIDYLTAEIETSAAASNVLYNAALGVFPYGTAVDSNLVARIFDGTAPYMLHFDTYNGITDASSNVFTFSSLDEGTRYTVVGTTVRDDGEHDYNWTVLDDYTRVNPTVTVGSNMVITTTTFEGVIDMRYIDPKAGRSNSTDLIATVMPSGCNNYSWMTNSSGYSPSAYSVLSGGWSLQNPVLSVPVLTRDNVLSYNNMFKAAQLHVNNNYDLVTKTIDNLTGVSNTTVTPFSTRDVVNIAGSVIYSDQQSGTVDVTASLSDGTFTLYTAAFVDNGTGVPDSWYQQAVNTGYVVGTKTAFLNSPVVYPNLQPAKDYIAVFAAVDNESAERFGYYLSFPTTTAPPSVIIDDSTTYITSTTASFNIFTNDPDSHFTCYAKAFPSSFSNPITDTVIADVIAIPDFTKNFLAGSANIYFTVNVPNLIPNTDYRFIAVAQDSVTGSNSYDHTDFTTLLPENYLEMTEYDGAYSIKWRHDATYTKPVRGVHVSNGKTSFVSRLDDVFGASDVFLAGHFEFNSYGGYTNNLIEAFDPFVVSPFEHSLSEKAPSFKLLTQTLDMQIGILTDTGTFTHSNGTLSVERESFCLRQMPFCTMSMYNITAASNVPSMKLFHEISNKVNLDNVFYDATTIYHPGTGLSMPVLQGKANVRSSTHEIACSSAYLFDQDDIDMEYIGYNTFRNLNRGFNAFAVKNLQAGVTYSFAVLTAQAATGDFPMPSREVTRLVTQVIGSQLSASSPGLFDAAIRLRADHVSDWNNAWFASATLTAKAGLSADDAEKFQSVKRSIRYSQYQLFSSVRDYGGSQLNPLQISAVDSDGSLFWNRELWVVPALLYTKPRSVRSLIEDRYESLRAAKTLAGAQGFDGARYPYVTDAMNYDAAPYWDVPSASYVFNSALVASAAWDYFRATHDRDWLLMKGFSIISSIADYIVSKASVDNNVTSFPDVLDVNGERATDPCFTVYICRTAVKAAIESCYELCYPVRDVWVTTYSGMHVEYYLAPNAEVIKNNADALHDDRMRILEPFMILHPHYIADFVRYDVPRDISTDHATLLANHANYKDLAEPGYADNPFNTLMKMAILQQVNRSTGTMSGDVDDLLHKAISDACSDIWGSMNADHSSRFNDISLSAMFALTFMNCFAGLRVSGGVARSTFYYEPMGIRAISTSYFPSYWQNVIVTSGDGITRNVINRELYP